MRDRSASWLMSGLLALVASAPFVAGCDGSAPAPSPTVSDPDTDAEGDSEEALNAKVRKAARKR